MGDQLRKTPLHLSSNQKDFMVLFAPPFRWAQLRILHENTHTPTTCRYVTMNHEQYSWSFLLSLFPSCLRITNPHLLDFAHTHTHTCKSSVPNTHFFLWTRMPLGSLRGSKTRRDRWKFAVRQSNYLSSKTRLYYKHHRSWICHRPFHAWH